MLMINFENIQKRASIIDKALPKSNIYNKSTKVNKIINNPTIDVEVTVNSTNMTNKVVKSGQTRMIDEACLHVNNS